MAPGGLLEDPVSITLGEPAVEGERAIKELCIRVLPGWSGLRPEQLKLSRISGGISNLLVKVAPEPVDSDASMPPPVAVKVFGDKTELLIDRDVELSTLVKLGNAGFGAKVLAVFGNGRIEEFLTAVTLTPEDMADPAFVPRIARKLRQLHDVDPGPPPSPGLVFDTIQGWMDMVRGLQFQDPKKAAAFKALDLDAMQEEVTVTRRMCEAVESPVVFAHNDLLSGNILVLQAYGVDVTDRGQCDLTGPLQFIDFEYSTAGYRGFDLGNHFNEYAGFDCDYGRYPGPEAQALFFRHYMAAAGAGDVAADGDLQAADVDPEELERLSAEANLFALASHIYWGVWALVQARYSPIDFDYIDYSALRWREYHRRKAEFVEAARKFWPL